MNVNRRKFLSRSIESLTALAVANTAVYAIGSAFKSLDGSLVAGAKSCSGTKVNSCGAGKHVCSGSWHCDTTTGTWWSDITCKPNTVACD